MNATVTATLTRHDRCDRCGAVALARAVLASGGELLFCGHHARRHGPKLRSLDAKLSIDVGMPRTPEART